MDGNNPCSVFIHRSSNRKSKKKKKLTYTLVLKVRVITHLINFDLTAKNQLFEKHTRNTNFIIVDSIYRICLLHIILLFIESKGNLG